MLAATDTFCSHSRPRKAQILQYRELFYSLFAQTDETGKRLVASALANQPYTPRQVLLYLALEKATIAAPILAYAKGLGQFDLLQIIDKTSILHHRVIANRIDLGQTVVKKLVDLGDRLVLRRLKNNLSVDKSLITPHQTALEELVTPQTEHLEERENKVLDALNSMDKLLQARFIQTPDNPPETAPSNDDAGEVKGLSTRITEIVRQNKARQAMDELVTMANRGGKLGKSASQITWALDTVNTSLEEDLLHATKLKDRQEQILILRRRFDLDASSAQAIFVDHSGDTLAVTLKAANVGNDFALKIIGQAIANVGSSPHNIRRMSQIYPALDASACRNTVKIWSDSAAQTSATYQPVTDEAEIRSSRSRDSWKVRTRAAVSENVLFGT